MADPNLLLSQLLAPVFAGHDPVVRPSERADYQANGVLAMAKAVSRNPRDLAAELLPLAAEALAGLATVEVAGPGFLNLTLTDEFLAAQVAQLVGDPNGGVRQAQHPETVVVDYSAPNVAKEMHVGHLRSTVIGDALVRVLTHVGHRVVRENHVGDWGTPFGMLIEHLVDVGESDALAALSASDLTAFYKQARGKFDASEAFQERSRERVVRLQASDPETLRLWKVLIDQSALEFQAAYDRLGVLLTPSDIVGESFYNPMLPAVRADLDSLGLIEESDGALVVFPPGFVGREGSPLPVIVQNSQGGSNYATTDLATVRDRVGRVGATWLIYVVGAPQAQHFAMVWKVCELADWLAPPARCVHVPFGNVLGEDKKMLRTRSGETFRLSDLIDEAIERADQAVADKNPDIVGDERRAVAEAIGLGAVKYADLSNDRVKDYVFSFDRMLAFEGNTAPYLQYAHARINSILRKANSPAGTIVLGEPQERALALALVGFDGAVWDTIDKLGPHRLCTYLFELAQAFTAFYEACPVLKDGVPPSVRASRLALCSLTADILNIGLGLLGITAPERM